MYHPLANFPWSMCAKNYEKLLRVDKVITTSTVCSFFGPPCMRQLAVTGDFGKILLKSRSVKPSCVEIMHRCGDSLLF